ncbi:MAG: F0F1 ATP synthase subunit A [Sandaracinaceae bacterium]|nr:F0F1 ATP synthase subunit A [Sandaracinaceae bacterium]
MRPDLFGDVTVFSIGPLPITRTVVTTLVLSATLAVLGRLTARAVVRRPAGRLAATARLTFGFLEDLVQQTAGSSSLVLTSFAGTLFLFIAASAIAGQLPGVEAPTVKLPATAALAASVFLAVPIAGIAKRGVWGYLREYFRPNPLLFPLHLVSEVSRTLALALRLFGNMMSGSLVVGLAVALVGLLVPIPLMALDLGIGLLQAYIFAVLACVYVGAAIRVGEEER